MSLGLGTLVVLLAAAAPGDAGPPPRSPAAEAVSLRWEAPPSCPGEDAVRRGLAGYLGEAVPEPAGAGVRAVARIRAEGRGYRLELRTETDSGVTTRETTSEDCGVLVDATALIVAIAVDPTSVVARTEVPPSPVAPASNTPDEVEAERAPPEPAVDEIEPEPAEPSVVDEPLTIVPAGEAEPAPERRVRFAMRAGGGVDRGALPDVAGGLRLVGAVLGAAWRVELRGDAWLPRNTVVQDGIGARISLWSAGARGCGVPRLAQGRLELPLCGGFEAGAMRGDPIGDRVIARQTSRRPWVAADASAGLAWVPRRFLAIVLQAELVVPIVRAGFRVGDIEVHRAGPIGGRGLLGLEARFP